MATHIACCEDTVALVVHGDVFCGELVGDKPGKPCVAVLNPLCSLPLPVRRIGAGRGFLGIVTSDGALYTCGRNDCGQLGLGFASSVNVTTPRLVSDFVGEDGPVHVCDFAGGWDHSVVITRGTRGQVFACGNNQEGVLGNGRTEGESHKFCAVHSRCAKLENASAVACGEGHTILLVDGMVFTWGVKNHQCLGSWDTACVPFARLLPPHRFQVEKMVGDTKVCVVEHIVSVSAGMYHQAAVGAGGTVFTWGDGRCFKLGHGTAEDCFSPTPVSFAHLCAGENTPAPHIAAVCCGRKCTVMLAQDGKVYKAGKDYWECLSFARPYRLGSAWARHAQEVQVSSERVFAIDELGALWAWGFGIPLVFHSEHAAPAPATAMPFVHTQVEPVCLDPPAWRRAHALAFAMVAHRRLGAGSRASVLHESLLEMILRFMRVW